MTSIYDCDLVGGGGEKDAEHSSMFWAALDLVWSSRDEKI